MIKEVMLEKVLEFIEKEKMINKGDKIVVAVSGGADSVCLFEILCEIKERYDLELFAVHVHHGIRGKDADEDYKFVEKLCESKGVKFFGFKYDVPALAKKEGLSEEEEGRIVRYRAFREVRDKEKADKIAVAHNANDLAETVIFSMARGSSVKGLGGIRPVRDDIIRPILCLEREEIEKYLENKSINYCTDITNSDSKYTRNKIRLNVIPELEKVNNQAVSHLVRLAGELNDLESYLEEKTKEAMEETIARVDRDLYLDIDSLCRLNTVIKSRLVIDALEMVCGKRKDLSAKHVDGILKLAKNESGKNIKLPYGMTARNEYGKIIISNKKASIKKTDEIVLDEKFFEDILKEEKRKMIELENVQISFECKDCVEGEFHEKLYTKEFDYDKMKFGLEIRNRKDGDYINLKGGRKKLKDYFIDMKIPREERDKILLLAKGSQVIWIVGYRINEEYKITKQSKTILMVEYIGGQNGR